MSFRARDDASSPSNDADAAQMDIDALEFEALENVASPRAETVLHDAFPRTHRRPLRRSGSAMATSEGDDTEIAGGDRQATRLLEALEALSSESGGPMPPSLRSLLGQLQGDDTAMAGLFPFMQMLESHGSHPRFHRMLQSLDPAAPAHVQLSGLSDLCESLSMSSEESLVISGFSVDKFVPKVLELVRAPSTMEVLLLAARALSSLFDLFPTVAIPKAMAANSSSGASSLVESICAKLLEIEYMDVAELAFQILERIVFCPHSETGSTTVSYRRAVIEANGFVALLQFIDFFPLEIQRTAARVVAGLCINLDVALLDQLQVALPLIAGLVRSSDSEMIQQGCKSFQALSTSPPFHTSQELAQLVATDETCETLVRLLEAFAGRGDELEQETSAPISVASCVCILQFLSAVLAAPHGAMDDQVQILRHTRLPLIVAKLVGMPTIVDDVALLRETLQLLIGLLPPPERLEEDEDHTTTRRAFVRAILPCVIHVFEVSSRQDVRYDCLGVILRICLLQQQFEEPSNEDNAELAHLASFLARVLRPENTSEPSTKSEDRNACVALQITQACLHSDSSTSTYAKSLFERHGVSAAVRQYAQSDEGGEGEGIRALSRLLVAEYLGEEDVSSDPSMTKLREIVRLLDRPFSATMDDHSTERSVALSEGLCELLALCQARQQCSAAADAWLTAHELASSGLARALNHVLQDSDGRWVFKDTFIDHGAHSAFLDGLIASVQDAISAEKEAFRVDTTAAGSTMAISTGSVTSDMDQLAQHIKVRVKIDDNHESASVPTEVKRNKRAVHDTVVLVEPLARIDTIEEFIAERLFGSRSPFGALGEEEALTRRRRQHRARRGENETEEKHAEEDHDEGHDEDHEEHEHDDDDEEDETEEDPEDDHDDESSDLRSDRPQKQKRLLVLFGDTVMRGDSSVLEAILKTTSSAPGSESGSSLDLPKVWTGSPHEFVFRVLGKEHMSKINVAKVEAPAQAEGQPSPLQGWDAVWDLLGILKHLHELLDKSKSHQLVNASISLQVHRALTQPVRVMTNSLPSWTFRVVEEYPFVLDYETRYDFLFATTCGAPRAISYLCRTLWKKAATAEDPPAASSTSTGRESGGRLSRRTARERIGGASSWRTATTALTNLSRMAKLPRLKVRVARSRLLQSAMKLFSMYGGKKAIIEIEFLGEVGTGLGPTTEFYTLVCQELQAAHLKLWRNDKDVDSTVDEDAGDSEHSVDVTKNRKTKTSDKTKKKEGGLPVRGYHRVAVYHCASCKHLAIPRCAIHDLLLTHEKSESDDEVPSSPASSIPQCAKCLDTRDWYSSYTACPSCCSKPTLKEDSISEDETIESPSASSKAQCTLRWWILSEEETAYLSKVYPRDVESIQHPVLQCSHCDTVNFPGTDAGIVVLDHTGERMVSRAGRRMYERDYRAVTKHVSPLCEGTPLKQLGVVLTREAVDTLVDCVKKSPELLDSEVESLCYMSEVTMQGEVEVVDAPFGLFPKPYHPTAGVFKSTPNTLHSGLSWFNFIGRFVAQAILDERLVNLPLSRAFLRALRGETLIGSDIARSLMYVKEVDPVIAQSLLYLHTLATEYDGLEETETETETKASVVESMGLAFTLVGAGSIELCDDGKNIPVTLATLGDYVRRNVDFLLHETIEHQVAAFHDGFQTISGCSNAATFLQSFSLDELEFLLADKCLTGDSMWDRDGKELRDHMVCDHGYTPHSRAIHDLIAILCALPLDDQRLFVKFVTGANRLPLGGLAKLEPKLTVVRKLASSSDDSQSHGTAADAVLPSASTCTNYLKLPEYSTRDVLERRLAYCIREGQGSFHLS